MRKLLGSILLAGAICLPVMSATTSTNAVPGTNTLNISPALTLGGNTNAWNTIVDFFSANGSNWLVWPHGMATTDAKSWGGGVTIGYQLSTFVVPTLGVEYFQGDIAMPSATVQLQLPFTVHVFGKAIQVVPLAYSGITTSLSGRGSKNGEAIGIFGTGAAVSLSKNWFIAGTYENRTSIGHLVLFGLGYQFR